MDFPVQQLHHEVMKEEIISEKNGPTALKHLIQQVTLAIYFRNIRTFAFGLYRILGIECESISKHCVYMELLRCQINTCQKIAHTVKTHNLAFFAHIHSIPDTVEPL